MDDAHKMVIVLKRFLLIAEVTHRNSRQELIHVVRPDEDDVLIVYEYDLKTGGTYRNAELITVAEGRIVEIQVFFGGAVA